MDRFHIVVCNYQRLSSFVDNFHKIRNFNPQRDRVFIFDCSNDETWQDELDEAKRLCEQGLTWRQNLVFIRRRNWAYNLGAIIDYYRWLVAGHIPPASYNFFLQDHYLDTERFVLVDSIPENTTIDLNEVEEIFLSDPEVGIAFCARLGVRVSVHFPNLIYLPPKGFEGKEYAPFKDTDGSYLYRLAPGGVKHVFTTDGENFICRPEYYVRYFQEHPEKLVEGNGDFGFCVAWLERLGKILYDRKVKWADLVNKVAYRNVEELEEIETRLGRRLSCYWYMNMIWAYYYGYDLMLDETIQSQHKHPLVIE